MVKKKSTICLRELSKCYYQGQRKIEVFSSLNVPIVQDKIAIVSGESGSGKSTLLHIIAGLESPTSGAVWFEQTNLTQMSEAERTQWRKQYIGVMFQFPYLIRELSVLENVMLPGLIAGKGSSEVEERSAYLLHQVGLEDRIDSRPCVLSGGEQQRVSLARALFNRPAFLLADEPTAHLDRARACALRDLLLASHAEYAIGLIIATHDEKLMFPAAQHICLTKKIQSLSPVHQESIRI